MRTTITEALAEIHTINKRLQSKREYIATYLYRPEQLRDPLEKDGGAPQIISNERQAIGDLEARLVKIRTAIAESNQHTQLTINDVTNSVAGWLTWRKEIAPNAQRFLMELRQRLDQARKLLNNNQQQLVGGVRGMVQVDSSPKDIVVNVNEKELAKEIEWYESTLGQLDGQLSLKNATLTIEVG